MDESSFVDHLLLQVKDVDRERERVTMWVMPHVFTSASFIEGELLTRRQDVLKNQDAYRLSTYLYKDGDGGRFTMGPLWDLDTTLGSYPVRIPTYKSTTCTLPLTRRGADGEWSTPSWVGQFT